MKLSIDQLKKKIEKTIDLTLDFKSRVSESDLIDDIGSVFVTGQYQLYGEQTILFKLHVKTVLTLPCAVTLKPVEYEVDFDFEEEVNDKTTEYQLIGDKIDIAEIVWGALEPEVPIAVVAADAPKGLYDKEKTVNPAFSSLKDHLKK